MPTLKQQRVIEELPKVNWNMAEAMRRSGYSKQTTRSGANYKAIRKNTQKVFDFDPNETKRKIKAAQEKFAKRKDGSNEARMIELEARISVPELRKQEITQTNPDKIVIQYLKPSTTSSIEHKTEEKTTP